MLVSPSRSAATDPASPLDPTAAVCSPGASGSPAAVGTQRVYFFGQTKTEGTGEMRSLLGGKGANLAEMTALGLPVPPGFTVTTESCAAYYDAGRVFPAGLMDEVRANIAALERETGKRFGDTERPLLVSVRSGAAVSMPGMMDTVLNLGLTDSSAEGLARQTGNPRFAYDAYRRLINMFGDVACGVPHGAFEQAFTDLKAGLGVREDTEVPAEGLRELCDRYKAVFGEHTGEPFPQDPMAQLERAIEAVFSSWNSHRAIAYRRLSGITGLTGTAVNVQTMVYGNTGETSATGVGFTRDPATGDSAFYGEFLINAQGEDVVAGIRTPRPVAEMRAWNAAAYDRLLEIRGTLERHYRDMQDIEFTIEDGRLFMLQTRTGKRTAQAAVRIACEMVREGLIDEREAVRRVPAGDLTQLLLPRFSAAGKRAAAVLTTGLPASPGAAVGRPAFTAEEAVERTANGEAVLLVREQTSPEDVEGMHSAAGILTSTGGMTSHAAVVARGWGKCCVAGAGELHIDAAAGTVGVGGRVFGRDDLLSIDGSTGEVLAGEVESLEPEVSGDFGTLMGWADGFRTLEVRANADAPGDARRARELGAQGIGLCRTEHMFFEGERIRDMREMILADTEADRAAALAKLLPYQRDDFEQLFEAMAGLPVTIRLLDPPLHEFLPADEPSQREVAEDLGVPIAAVQERVEQLHEANPMLGHRGCRLAVTYPEILRMQVRAIVEAAAACRGRGVEAQPEIMIPLVGTEAELEILRGEARAIVDEVAAERGLGLAIPIGTMMEIPRACLVAGAIARHADFVSFGTNDLTQLAFGYSRDDINEFLPSYLERGVLPADPFQSIDRAGVGELVRLGAEGGRRAKPGLKAGVCGEHGGDPASIELFQELGLDYVSCSPFRVPIARLAAAQAALAEPAAG